MMDAAPLMRMEVQIVAEGTNDPITTINKGGFFEMRVLVTDLGVLTYLGETRPATNQQGDTLLTVATTYFDIDYDAAKTDVQTNDSQYITFTGTPTSNGTFTLTVNDGGTLRTTAPITFAANRSVTANNIKLALNTLLKPTATSPDVVEVVHEPVPAGTNNRWRVRFINRLGSQDVPEMTGAPVGGLGTTTITVTEAISGETSNPLAFADALNLRTRYDANGQLLNDDPVYYSEVRKGSRLDTPTRTGIDDLGGSHFLQPYAGANVPVEIARIRMDAKDVGLVTFDLNYLDIVADFETGLIGFNNPVTADLIEVIDDSITVTEINAGDDTVNTTEGATAFIDIPVLDNDGNNPPTPNTAKTIQSIDTTGTIGNVQILPGNTLIRYTPPGGDVNGVTTFTYTVIDPSGNTDTATVTVDIAAVNDAPTLAPIGNPPALPLNSGTQTINLTGISAGGGEVQSLIVTATSSNPSLIPNPTVSYTSPNATGTLSFTPVAGQSGSAVITVTVTDNGGTENDGVDTVTQTFTVTVTENGGSITTPGFVGIVADPEVPGGRLLVINGTSTSNLDLINVYRSLPNRTLVMMPLSGITRYFDNSAFDRVLINGFDGSDRIVLDPSFSQPTTINGDAGDDTIFGGAGNDVIRGGEGADLIYGFGGEDFIYGDNGNDYLSGDDGNDVVLGGNSDDVIWGGLGNDVLNGGAGFDEIYGLSGDDLIIGGNLTQANSQSSLQAIQSLWTANQPFNTRVSSLSGQINSTTVTSDNRSDWIFGNDGRDWIVDYALQDLVFDFNASTTNGDRRN